MQGTLLSFNPRNASYVCTYNCGGRRCITMRCITMQCTTMWCITMRCITMISPASAPLSSSRVWFPSLLRRALCAWPGKARGSGEGNCGHRCVCRWSTRRLCLGCSGCCRGRRCLYVCDGAGRADMSWLQGCCCAHWQAGIRPPPLALHLFLSIYLQTKPVAHICPPCPCPLPVCTCVFACMHMRYFECVCTCVCTCACRCACACR